MHSSAHTSSPTDAAVQGLPSAAVLTEEVALELLIPENDVSQPELSIVIPALNEEITIARFVAWCLEGLREAQVTGEILIIDSSTDRTSEIALANGARVLRVPKRGLGRAYIDALPYIRGRYVLMGDADCTYDFRQIGAFMDRFRSGYEYVMGSRFKGYIEPGSMPPLHQYLGTPVTTWILNFLYGSHFSDIHCGMRGITLEALQRMGIQSQSWEYASEMVLKSVHMKLRTAEVPVRFLKDEKGRLSHHKRAGWFSPWYAAWINLRAMFVYGADFFLFRPGLLLFFTGLLLTLPLSRGPVRVGSITFSLHWMLLGLVLTVLGLHGFYVGAITRIFFDYSGVITTRWLERFAYTRSVVFSGLAVAAGITLALPLALWYLQSGFALTDDVFPTTHLAVTGLLFIIGGFMNFTFTLAIHAAAAYLKKG